MVMRGKEQIASEDNICELLGLDINRTALEIVKADLKSKDIPFATASKYLVAMNPHSTHSSAVKSFNASVPTQASGHKMPSAFLISPEPEEVSTMPYKRSRINSQS